MPSNYLWTDFEMMSDNSYTNMREMLRGYLSDLQVRSENSGVIGVSSGFQVLDYLMGGFVEGLAWGKRS